MRSAFDDESKCRLTSLSPTDQPTHTYAEQT
jgi:hypothetical protein